MPKTSRTNSFPPCLSRIGYERCTGCAACANSCQQSAITIKLNSEGFYRPVLIEDLCNDCMACIKHCPVSFILESVSPKSGTTTGKQAVYAAWSEKEEVRVSSSSGGIFSELAYYALGQSGRVCGCTWGEDWTPRHIMVEKLEDVYKLRGSKYVPSFVDEAFYRKIIGLAKAGTIVLFCGTPCQVAGLNLIAPREARRNLLLVDLVCHGVPSLSSFWRYLEWRFGSIRRVEEFSFRSKEVILPPFTIRAITTDGAKYMVAAGQDPWYRMSMVYHIFLQRSCFSCAFSSCPRQGDISLGDFWGIPEEWHNRQGDSVVLVNTERGEDVLQQLIRSRRISVKQSDYALASGSVGRLRGAIYDIPLLRSFALLLIAKGAPFIFPYCLCYLPLKFWERISQYMKRYAGLLPLSFSRPKGRRG